MNCGRSSSVEWKLPKLQRRVRFPSPAPAPPGHAPGGFVMPTSHPPSTECGGTIGATLSPRELGPAVPVQNSPCTPGTPPVPVQNSPSLRCTVPVPVQNSPSTSHTVPVPVQNSPSTPKISQFGAFCSCWESFIPFLLPTSRAWRILSRYHQQQDRHATTPGTKLAPHARHATSPGTKLAQHAQNLPIWRVLLLLGEFYPVLLPTSRAWRVFSRTNTSTTTGTKETTPPHNTQSHAMKDYPPTLHRQHHTMKHSSPQHAINNQNSPIFTMQGRTFFHNTHHTPTPGRHFFQPTPLPAK